MSFCYPPSALRDFSYPESGETTKYQLKTFDEFPCIAKLDLSTGALVTREETSPTIGMKAALGYHNYEGAFYLQTNFPREAHSERLYMGGQLQYFLRRYPESLFNHRPSVDVLSQANLGWYHSLGIGVAVGGTMIEDQPGGIHYGVVADYTTWPRVWEIVETPIKLGAKFLLTELKGLREFTGIFTLDLGALWAVASLPSATGHGGTGDHTGEGR